MSQSELEQAIDKLESNLETLKSDETTEVEKGVAAEQAKHNAESVYELYKQIQE